jgi:hypothetical protein
MVLLVVPVAVVAGMAVQQAVMLAPWDHLDKDMLEEQQQT